MIQMTNIMKLGDKIQCNYSPEDSQGIGAVSVSISTTEFIEVRKTDYDRDSESYVSKVKLKLLDLAEQKEIPTRRNIIWY